MWLTMLITAPTCAKARFAEAFSKNRHRLGGGSCRTYPYASCVHAKAGSLGQTKLARRQDVLRSRLDMLGTAAKPLKGGQKSEKTLRTPSAQHTAEKRSKQSEAAFEALLGSFRSSSRELMRISLVLTPVRAPSEPTCLRPPNDRLAPGFCEAFCGAATHLAAFHLTSTSKMIFKLNQH